MEAILILVTGMIIGALWPTPKGAPDVAELLAQIVRAVGRRL